MGTEEHAWPGPYTVRVEKEPGVYSLQSLLERSPEERDSTLVWNRKEADAMPRPQGGKEIQEAALFAEPSRNCDWSQEGVKGFGWRWGPKARFQVLSDRELFFILGRRKQNWNS